MQFLNDKLGEVTIFNQDNVINVIYKHDDGYSQSKSMYQLPYNEAVFKKLSSYKTVRGVLAYCDKELDLVFHVPHDYTDHTVTALPSPNTSLALPSEVGEVEGNLFGSSTSSVANENDPAESADLSDVSLESSSPPVAVLAPTISDTPLFIDVETTGLSSNDEVIELAIVDIHEKVLFKSLFKPSRYISNEAMRVHGITNEDIAKSPKFNELWHKISKIIEGRTLVFYNANFDTRMIAQTLRKTFECRLNYRFKDFIPNPVHCLMLQYARHWGDYNPWHGDYTWQKLAHACHQQGIKTNDLTNHRAVGDAIKTVRLYKHLQNE